MTLHPEQTLPRDWHWRSHYQGNTRYLARANGDMILVRLDQDEEHYTSEELEALADMVSGWEAF